jgi:glutathione synthase/RimK-type ligase-like ATP-grasp enzyme
MGRPDRLIYTSVVGESDLRHLQDVRRCPTLFQERIQKSADVRITVVGKDIHATTLVGPRVEDVDIRRNNMEGVRYGRTEIPRRVRNRIRTLVASYNLRFATLDFAITGKGEWIFFEVNPNGQWAWLDLVGGSRIAHSFVREFQDV